MKVVSSPSLVCAGVLFVGVLSGFADTVTLKSGEVINGKIVSDTEQEIVMDVAISAGISDQKTIAKSDVQTVLKASSDELAYNTIKSLQITPASLPATGYQAAIKSMETFLTSFPESSHAAAVKTTLDAFKKEQAQVKAGNFKWDNRWYTPAQFERNKNFLNSQILLATMKTQASRRDFIGVLNTFTEFEKTYHDSLAYPEAVDLAQAQIRFATSEVEHLQAVAKVQEAQFNSGVVLAGEPQKSQMIAAHKAQIAAADAALAAVPAAVKWKPIIPLSAKSFEAFKTTFNAEAPRIEKLPSAAMRNSLALTAQAKTAIQNKNAMEAEGKIREAEAIWKDNKELPSLKSELAALKAKPGDASTPAPGASPAAAAATPADPDAPAAPAAPSPTPKKHFWNF